MDKARMAFAIIFSEAAIFLISPVGKIYDNSANIIYVRFALRPHPLIGYLDIVKARLPDILFTIAIMLVTNCWKPLTNRKQVMENERIIMAIGRIERALSRIEAAKRLNRFDQNLEAKHTALKSELRGAIETIDQLIARQED